MTLRLASNVLMEKHLIITQKANSKSRITWLDHYKDAFDQGTQITETKSNK